MLTTDLIFLPRGLERAGRFDLHAERKHPEYRRPYPERPERIWSDSAHRVEPQTDDGKGYYASPENSEHFGTLQFFTERIPAW